MRQFTAYNGAAPTTAALVPVQTGTAIKTHLQIAPPSTEDLEVIAWGVSFAGTTFGTKVKCELIETDVAATVTAHVAAGIVRTDPGRVASHVTLGAAATGYNASAEGTITASRLLAYEHVDLSAAYSYTWPLGNYDIVQPSKFLRVRLTSSTDVAAITWVTWGE